MNRYALDAIYLLAGVCFIIALKAMSSPRTARRGNLLASCGMAMAVVATLLSRQIVTFQWILVGVVIGAGIGAYLALTVKMTAMPQMVAMFNGLGGLASALVVLDQYWKYAPADLPTEMTVTIAVSVLIGAVTFTGSVVAFAKLQGLVPGRPVVYPFRRAASFLLPAVALALGAVLTAEPANAWALLALTGIAAVGGVLFVLPIGGADMPVVIALLNSYSGLAAAATGFVLNNNVLVISGALVGASGIILTRLMCVAMNRSLANVLFGAFGRGEAAPGEAAPTQRTVRRYTPQDAALTLDGASLVMIVPGYGMAVAQAQHAVKELADLLTERGTKVRFAIHPVAGRMPGHMNVLLAEADVPYDQLCDLDEANSEFPRADVALIVGANDVTNPAARKDASSPIYGMPILNVDAAGTIIICKRSLNPGFAGIDNELFYLDKTMMLFADAKASLTSLVAEMKL